MTIEPWPANSADDAVREAIGEPVYSEASK
jgi:hypothetical protein